MDGWPGYWPGLPPMWYATHCVSPCLAMLSRPGEGARTRWPRASSATGRAASARSIIKIYNCPFAIETATFKIKGSDVVAEVTRSLFDTARQYRESFDVTASNVSFEWQQVRGRGAGAAHARACRSRRSRGG